MTSDPRPWFAPVHRMNLESGWLDMFAVIFSCSMDGRRVCYEGMRAEVPLIYSSHCRVRSPNAISDKATR